MVAGGVAGGADIAEGLALGNGIPDTDDGGTVHMRVQGGIGVALIILAVVDLHIVAPAVVVSSGGDNAAADGVNRGATRCGIVGAAVVENILKTKSVNTKILDLKTIQRLELR